MKAYILLLFFFLPVAGYSQGVFTNQTHIALQKVISDYPNNFKNIRGKLITQDPQTSDYISSVEIPGALNSVITKYGNSGDKDVYSWKCLLLETEEFETASKKYNEVYNQIKNSIIKVDGEKPFILNGTYEAPTETKKFSNASFYLVPAYGDLKTLKVELSLQFYVTEWKLSLLVYDQQIEGVVME